MYFYMAIVRYLCVFHEAGDRVSICDPRSRGLGVTDSRSEKCTTSAESLSIISMVIYRMELYRFFVDISN